MIVQFNDWQAINLTQLQNSFTAGLNEFFNTLDNSILSISSLTARTNTHISGSTFNGFNFDIFGSNLINAAAPVITFSSIALGNASSSILTTGSLNYNVSPNTFSGYLDKLSLSSINNNLLFLGHLNIDPFGNLSGGTLTNASGNSNSFGSSFSYTGNFNLDANSNISGGTITSFTFADISGRSLSVSGANLDAVTIDTLSDPNTGSAISLFNYVNSASNLAGNDTITGGNSNDTINGFAGNDTLNGGAGIDTLIGGTGDDTYVVDSTTDIITEAANEGNDTIQASMTYTLNTANVENLTLIGNAAINATGDTGNNLITGNIASNTLNGGAGDDTLDGGAPSGYNPGIVDTLNGDAGNDTLLSRSFYSAGIYNGGADTDLLDFSQADAITAGRRANEGAGVVVNLATSSASTYYVKASNFTWADANGQLTLSSIENVRGTTQSDIITGDNNDNVLDGGSSSVYKAGAVDVLNGGAGNDTFLSRGFFSGGTYDGGLGTDLLDFSQMDAYSAGRRSAEGAGVNVNLSTAIASTYYLKSTGFIWADATGNIALSGIENVRGTTQGDLITGNAGNNVLEGGTGNDTLNGGAGIDTLIGGTGDDIFVFNSYGTNDADIANDFVSGHDKIQLSGSAFSSIAAGIYTDMFLSANGATTAQDSNDYLIYNKLTGDLFFDADANGAGTQQLIANFLPNTNLVQSDFIGALNVAQSFILTGTLANDTLIGNQGNDTLNGLAGNDTLDGKGGVDTMYGGSGVDTYYVDNVGDKAIEDFFHIGQLLVNGTPVSAFFENSDKDSVFSSVTYTMDFGISNLTLTGTGDINGYGNIYKSNVITGNIGNNTLDGGLNTNPELTALTQDGVHFFNGGGDTLIGGLGDDTYIIHGGETVIENPGEGIDTLIITTQGVQPVILTSENNIENITLANDGVLIDTVQGNSLNNLLIGNNLLNNLYGFGGTDTLRGLGGDDRLFGMDGNDILEGGDGADSLFGDVGNDTLTGGLGADTFVFDSLGTINADIVTDFVSGQDKISLSTLSGNFVPLLNGIYTDMFLTVNGSAVAQDANDYLIYNKTTGDLFYDADANGAGAQQLIANFLPNTTVLQSDFVGALNTIQPVNPTNLLIVGSGFNDTLAGGQGNDLIYGLAGDDVITGSDGNDTTDGGDGNDSIFGGAGDDALAGGLGDDKLFGENSNDSIDGGDGQDTLIGGAGIDKLNGGNGADLYVFNAGNEHSAAEISDSDALLPDFGIINLYNQVRFDSTTNGDTLNLFAGDTGVEWIRISSGLDINSQDHSGIVSLNVNASQLLNSVSIIGNNGVNILTAPLNPPVGTGSFLGGADGNDTLIGGNGNDSLWGDEGNDTLNGNGGNDSIIGHAGNDILNGGVGDDGLTGGLGNDSLTGLVGADSFGFMFGDAGTPGNITNATDTITDFSVAQGDKLYLANMLNGETSSTILNYLDILTNAGNTEIHVSSNGGFTGGNYSAGAEDQRIILLGVNLFTDTGTEAALLQNLITNNKLIID